MTILEIIFILFNLKDIYTGTGAIYFYYYSFSVCNISYYYFSLPTSEIWIIYYAFSDS